MLNPKPGEIWLVRFPFSDLTSTKVRGCLKSRDFGKKSSPGIGLDV